MDRPPDHYAVLGVAVDSDAETLRDAYRAKLRTTHPDTAETAADAAMFNEVVDAGDVLLDPDRRKVYNEQVARFWADHTDRARTQRVEQAAATSSSRFDPSFLVLGALIVIVGVAVWQWFPNRGVQSTASVSTSGTEVVAVAAATEEPEAEPTVAPTPTPEPTEVPETAADTADEDATATAPLTTDTDTGNDADSDDGATASDDTADSESMPRSERPTTSADDDVADVDSGEAATTDTSDATTDDSGPSTSDADDAALVPLSELPARGAVYRAPTLFLEGPVPNQEAMDLGVAVASAVVGPENVVNEYVIHPDAPLDFDGNVRVEQAVQFAPGSATILSEFESTLAVGYAVLLQNSHVTAIIEGHTDDVGSDVANLALSERRAVAVVDWMVERGIERDRMISVGFGEGEPIASNDTIEGRATNRRIEAQFLNLLNPPEE